MTESPVRQSHDPIRLKVLSAWFGGFMLLAGLGIASETWLVADASQRQQLPPSPSGLPIEVSLVDVTAGGVRAQVDARAALDGYAWLDRERGQIQIPIDDAIDWLLAEPPAWGGPRPAGAPPSGTLPPPTPERPSRRGQPLP